MKGTTLYSGTTYSFLSSDSFAEDKTIFKIAPLSSLSQTELLKAANEASFSGEQIEGFREVLENESNSAELKVKLRYINGVTLEQLMGRPFTILEKLKLCITITKRLLEVHRREIVHLHLNPGHILMEEETGKLFFISLGLATRIQKKIALQNRLIFTEADPDFIAPEQTGRISSDIGFYSDIYSLGVIFYRLFTEKLPFESKEGAAKIHAHIALTPQLPHTISGTPRAVSDVIMKMLAKDVRARYQSAQGVLHDLLFIANALEHRGIAEVFELGTNDASGVVRFTDHLYGRNEQLNKIKKSFQNAVENEKTLLLVYGHSGVGKSALVERLYRPVIQEGGFFVSGKCDPLKTDVPYFAFSQAFGKLIEQILLLNENELLQWKSELNRVLNPIGRVLYDIIPGLDKLVENEPELPELNGLEAQLRFNYALHNFFQVFSNSGKPLVLFTDDLQWSDASSLNLIRSLLTDKDLKNVLIIGAYRDNEITAGHVLLQFKMELEELGIVPEEIYLENLQYKDVHQMILDMLGKSALTLNELVNIVHKKSGGNALFVNQFIKAIYNNEMLFFDRTESSWKWDAEKIIGYNVEGDIVNLFLKTIHQLPPKTISVLKLASCIGNKFGLADLSVITKEEKVRVYQHLKPALHLDLIIESRDGNLYFVHDRVQQAFYTLNNDQKKGEFHLKIGRLLLENTPIENLRECIFDIVNQLNFSKILIEDPSEAGRLCELNIIAGQRSQSATAYELALQYFENAIQFLPAATWDNEYKFTFDLYLKAAEAANQCNNQVRFLELIQVLDEHVIETIDRLKLAKLKIKNANVNNNQKLVIEIGIEALKKAKINFKLHPSQIDVLLGYLNTNYRLSKFTLEEIAELPKNENEEILICMEIIRYVALAAYFLEPNLVPLLIFKLFRLTLEYGLSPNSPFVFVVFGFINIAFMGKMEKGLEIGQLGLRISEVLNNEEQIASLTMNYHVFISHWLMHLGKTISDLEFGFKKGLETGDFEFNSINGLLIIYNYFFSGEPIDKVLKRGELLSKQVAPLNQIMQIERIKLFRQTALSLVVGVKDFNKIAGEVLNEDTIAFPNEPSFGSYYENVFELKKFLALVFNQNEIAWEHLVRQKEYLIPVKGTIAESLFYFYENVTITPIFNQRSKAEQKSLLKILKKNLEIVKNYAKYSEVNFKHRYELMNAEYHLLLNNTELAIKFYSDAIRHARINKFIHEEALAWERMGSMYQSMNQPEVAQFYFTNAYKAYSKWGAKAKLIQMKERYAGYISLEEIGLKSTYLDLNTILKTINLISGEVVLEKILTGLMNLVTENAGAERAFLITQEKDKKIIKASVDKSKNEIEVLQNSLFGSYGEISHSVVNHVARTGEVLVLEDAPTVVPYANDEYILKNEIKSIVCLPLKHAGTSFAYLYLENKFLSGAFTPERVEILQVMATQTAISLQNAMLLERTTQLNEELVQEVEVRKAVEENLRINEKRLEEYNTNLEFKVKERTTALQSEKEKTDELLLNILPLDIARELKEKGYAEAQKYESVSVLFTDFKGFSIIAEKMSAAELVAEIDYCFKEFDRIIQKYGIEKIKTIGDAYMVVGGLPVTNTTHALDVINAGIEIRDFIEEHKKGMIAQNKPIFEVRIGIHTGNVVAGIVGLKKFAYDIWGDTVNVAARMESSSEAGKINISGATYQLVKDHFKCTYRGKIKAKNKGEVDMYFVEGRID